MKAASAKARACRRHGLRTKRRNGWSDGRPQAEVSDVFLKSMQLDNFLSFGKSEGPVEMRPLNVLIGPNGAGKSNFIEALALLQAAPNTSSRSDLNFAIREGGGVRDWIWKGDEDAYYASINAIFENALRGAKRDLRYVLRFSGVKDFFRIEDERIENHYKGRGRKQADFHYRLNKTVGEFRVYSEGEKKPELKTRDDVDTTTSILAQHLHPRRCREITYLAKRFAGIGLYREWEFGPRADVRDSQKADLFSNTLDHDSRNLYLVFNRLLNDVNARSKLLKSLRVIYDNIDDVRMSVDGGRVKVMFQEGRCTIPANRLSDGTLRFMSLLAILCDPSPTAPLVCIDEPELGLHPDVLPTLAELLMEASERMQLVVTTHSETLVDAMTIQPENILVADRTENGTQLTRLDPKELQVWLKKYSLRDLWERGQIGGVRW